MLIPVGDDDRKLSGPSYITTGLIVLNLFVFLFLQRAGDHAEFTYGWSMVPYEITHGEDLVETQFVRVEGQGFAIPQSPGPPLIYLTILSAMFMHGGFAHLFGNLLYLWIFGDNVEHRFGRWIFLLFYVVSGIVASCVQILMTPDTVIPTLGASGAISGVLGAYLVLFPRNKVYALFFFRVISVPAIVAIGLWIVFQIVSGWGAITSGGEVLGGIAYGAHIGGFVAGAFAALILRLIIKDERTHLYTSVSESDGSKRYW